MAKKTYKDIKLTYDDVSIVPEVVSTIESRKECNIGDERGFLPIFAAPMGSVINEKNIKYFLKEGINIVVPRTIEFNKRLALGEQYNVFIALSLKETNENFIDIDFFNVHNNDTPIKICIDIANGHMKREINLVKTIKDKYGDKVIVMAGNVANPKTYKEYEKAGCDYLRVGIGGGNACLTASNTGVYHPYFSLIEEMYNIKKEMGGKCKIVADGNIRGYRDIQKALIFADYVMIGSVFNKALESAGKTTYGKCYWNIRGYKLFRPLKTLFYYGKEVNPFDGDICKKWKNGEIVLWKQYYGMSTKLAQKLINPNAKLKTSEGLVKYQKVEYTLSGWVENERDFLASAMSYTNSRTLEEYKDSEYCIATAISYNK